MKIHLSKFGAWIVNDFYDIIIKLQSHRYLTESSKNLIDSLSQCGMKPSTSSKVLNADSSINEIKNATH